MEAGGFGVFETYLSADRQAVLKSFAQASACAAARASIPLA